jgi:hypothetical protein
MRWGMVQLREVTWLTVDGGVLTGDPEVVLLSLDEWRGGTSLVLDLRAVDVFGAAAVRLAVAVRARAVSCGTAFMLVARPSAQRVLDACPVEPPLRVVSDASEILFSRRAWGGPLPPVPREIAASSESLSRRADALAVRAAVVQTQARRTREQSRRTVSAARRVRSRSRR